MVNLKKNFNPHFFSQKEMNVEDEAPFSLSQRFWTFCFCKKEMYENSSIEVTDNFRNE